MIEEEAVNGAVSAGYKCTGEAANVQTASAFFAFVAATEELDVSVWVVRKQVDDLSEQSQQCSVLIASRNRETDLFI